MDFTKNRTIAINDKEGRLTIRGKIDNYEKSLSKHLGDSENMDEINNNGLTEYLIGGAYTRVLKIPKGVSIVSKIWNRERLWIVISGEVAVTTETDTQVIKAPYIGQPPLGSKTALFAKTDVLWAAITGVPEADNVDDVEKYVITENYNDIDYPWDKLENKS